MESCLIQFGKKSQRASFRFLAIDGFFPVAEHPNKGDVTVFANRAFLVKIFRGCPTDHRIMASFKNASKTKQKLHRERSQPNYRKHLGQLEKKKDYKLRAKDYQEKRDTLKVLHQKAEQKNPDEFYFHMTKSRLEDGIHYEFSEKDERIVEQSKLLNTQNLRYVRFKWNQERKKIDSLQSALHFIDPSTLKCNKHTIFLDGRKKISHFDAAKHLDTHPAMLGRRFNRPRRVTLTNQPVALWPKATALVVNREQRKMYSELLKRTSREQELKVVAEKLQATKNVAESKNSKAMRVRKGDARRAPVFKWQFERKK